MKAGDLELELIDALTACVRQRLPEEPPAAYARVRAPVLPLGSRRRSARPQSAGPVRGGCRSLAYRAAAPRAGRGEGPRLQPGARARRLAFPVHRGRDRLRRHAVPGRLGDHGAEPPGLRDRADRPSGDAGRARPARASCSTCSRPGATAAPGSMVESVIHAEVARQSDPDRLAVLQPVSSWCSRRCGPPSRIGRRCAPGPQRWPRSSPSRRRSLPTSHRVRRLPGLADARITSPSWATASTSSTAGQSSSVPSPAPGWGSCAGRRRSRSSTWATSASRWPARRIRWC